MVLPCNASSLKRDEHKFKANVSDLMIDTLSQKAKGFGKSSSVAQWQASRLACMWFHIQFPGSWWHIADILVLRRPRQKGLKFKAR